MNVNSDTLQQCIIAESGAAIGEYSLPVVNWGAEPQKGGGIARAWIVVDMKVYPGIPIPKGWRRVPVGTVVNEGGDFVAFFYVLL